MPCRRSATGGWIRIIKLDPINGFAAESTASLVIQGATQFGSAPRIASRERGDETLFCCALGRRAPHRNRLGVTIPASGLIAGALTVFAVRLPVWLV